MLSLGTLRDHLSPRGDKVGKWALFHTGFPSPPPGVHYWATKRLPPLFCPLPDLPCEHPVGVHGGRMGSSSEMMYQLVFTFVKSPDFSFCGGYLFPHALSQMSGSCISLPLWALTLKFNFLGCFIIWTI